LARHAQHIVHFQTRTGPADTCSAPV
jgi:hypothetical protein